MKVLRKRSLQRVLTAILSIAMIFTSLPVNMLSGVFGVPGEVKAANLKTYEVDISGGLIKGRNYLPEGVGELTVLDDMSYSKEGKYVQGKNNAKTNGSSSVGTVPDSGAALILTTPTSDKTETMQLVVKVNSDSQKKVYLVKTTGTTIVDERIVDTDKSEIIYALEPGTTYYLYRGSGSKIKLYSVAFKTTKYPPDSYGTIKWQWSTQQAVYISNSDKVSVNGAPVTVNDKNQKIIQAASGEASANVIEPEEGSVLGEELWKLKIDATASGAKCTIRPSGNWVQFNKGTIIHVPLGVGKNTIKLTMKNADNAATIGGKSINKHGTDNIYTYVTVAKTSGTYVDIVATENDYIGDIELKIEEATSKDVTIEASTNSINGNAWTPSDGIAVVGKIRVEGGGADGDYADGEKINMITGTEYTFTAGEEGKKDDLYKVYVNDGDVNKKNAYTYLDDSVEALGLVVEERIQPKVTINLTGSALLGDGKLVLSDNTAKAAAAEFTKNDASKTVTLIHSHEYEFKISGVDNRAYEIGDITGTCVSKDKDNAKLLKASELTAFSSAESDAVIPVTLSSTAADTTFVIDPADTGLDIAGANSDITLVLTPSNSENKTYEVKNGGSVELYGTESYAISVKAEGTYGEGDYSDYFGAVYTDKDGNDVTYFKAATEANTINIKLTKLDTSKHVINVWDFGAEALENTKWTTYNNKLTVDILKNAIENGQKISDLILKTGDDTFVFDGKKASNHRIYLNSEVKDKKAEEAYKSIKAAISGPSSGSRVKTADEEYVGALMSGGTYNVSFGVNAEQYDILTFAVGENAGSAVTFGLFAPDAETAEQAAVSPANNKKKGIDKFGKEIDVEIKGSVLTFPVSKAGTNSLAAIVQGGNTKPGVARITRETPNFVKISGKIKGLASDYDGSGKVLFNPVLVGSSDTLGYKLPSISGNIAKDGSYSVTVPEQYRYSVTLYNMETYAVSAVNGEAAVDGVAGFDLAADAGAQTGFDIDVVGVDLVTVSGEIKGLASDGTTALDAAEIADYLKTNEVSFKLTKPADKVYQPELTFEGNKYSVKLEKGVEYSLSVNHADDYVLKTAKISATKDTEEGPEIVLQARVKNNVKVVFKLHDDAYDYNDEAKAETVSTDPDDAKSVIVKSIDFKLITVEDAKPVETGYGYSFTDPAAVSLREGQYQVTVDFYDDYYTQVLTKDAKVTADGATIYIPVELTKKAAKAAVAYKSKITVGKNKDYETISEALEAVRSMGDRTKDERVTIVIDPGTYDEMLRVDVPYVTLKNASASPSIAFKNSGVDVDDNAVRITSYYGVGYNYFSMNSDYLYDEEVLAVNTYNGYYTVENPSGGGTGNMWNATVWVSADGFEADGIIFENAFNQYISEKEEADTHAKQGGAKEGKVTREDMKAGDTDVQQKDYVERAAALAFGTNISASLNKCAVISHQDALYGGAGSQVYFNQNALYGGTDYIFGGMNALFDRCDLIIQVSNHKNDFAYITAVQNNEVPGYLFYNCTVKNTDSSVMNADYISGGSKPAYWGRSWSGKSNEVLFYNTKVETAKDTTAYEVGSWKDGKGTDIYNESVTAADEGVTVDGGKGYRTYTGKPLIAATGWYSKSYLSDVSNSRFMEYGTIDAGDTSGRKAPVSDKNIAKFKYNGEEIAVPLVIDATQLAAYIGAPASAATDEKALDAAVLDYFYYGPKAKKAAEEAAAEEAAKKKAEEDAKALEEALKKGVFPIDITGGLKPGVNYLPEGVGELGVLAEMPYSESAGVGSVQGKVNPSPNAGKVPTEGSALYVTTPDVDSDYTIRLIVKTNGDSSKLHYLVKADGEIADQRNVLNDKTTTTYELDPNTTYYLYRTGSKIKYYEITFECRKIARNVWSEVAAPVIGTVSQGDAKLYVSVNAALGDNGGDLLTVELLNARGETVAVKTAGGTHAVTEDQKFEFEPTETATYYVRATLARETEEEEKVSEIAPEDGFRFSLPLLVPSITAVTNKGTSDDGTCMMEAEWTEVEEATSYMVRLTVSGDETVQEVETKDLKYRFLGLTKGSTVSVSVCAIRKMGYAEPEYSEYSEVVKEEVTGSNDRTWKFSSFGVNAKADDIDLLKVDDDNLVPLTIGSKNGTKLNEEEPDGLAFYYTELPNDEDFTFTAKVGNAKKAGSTNPSAQSGFGLMAIDKVLPNGTDAYIYDNAYQVMAAEEAYYFDPAVKNAEGKYVGAMTSTKGDGVTFTMQLGVGYDILTGISLAEYNQYMLDGTKPALSNTHGSFDQTIANAAMTELYRTGKITDDSTPAEVRAAFTALTGTFNDGEKEVYGKRNMVALNIGTDDKPAYMSGTPVKIGETPVELLDEFIFKLERRNNGYQFTYMDPAVTEEAADGVNVAEVVWSDGTKENHKILGSRIAYDEKRNALTQIDKNAIYVGFMAARYTQATFDKYSLETYPTKADNVFETVVDEVDMSLTVASPEVSNTSEYILKLSNNAKGDITVINSTTGGVAAAGKEIAANEKPQFIVDLIEGENVIDIVFEPDKDSTPGVGQIWKYAGSTNLPDKITIQWVVRYASKLGTVSGDIYVSQTPAGKKDGSSLENATDIYSAFMAARPGQTILLNNGKYDMSSYVEGINVSGSNDGEKDDLITVKPLEENGERVVLDFKKRAKGIEIGADYWHLMNFDICKTVNNAAGITISGSHNIIEGLNTYENGDSGLYIQATGSMTKAEWPAYNTVINCTSYMNYDEAYENADGFAAKIKVGEGNKFIGCVSAYNADDGWDLYAKVDSGEIGAVTIENCVAYKNGYLRGISAADNGGVTKILYRGKDFVAGNGNGFKMGGSGVSGKHVLKNSYAFFNYSNGVHSNSGPDIRVYDVTSYANKGVNLSLNPTNVVNSDFIVNNMISVEGNKKDSINLLGNQAKSAVYNETNFLWDGVKSINSEETVLGKSGADIFKSVDMSDAGIDVDMRIFIKRDSNGNIDLGDFLALTDEAKAIAGEGAGASKVNTTVNEILESEKEINVFANAYKTLSDVKVDGLTWVYGDTPVKDFAGTSTRFEAKNAAGQTVLVRVNFIEVTGVSLVTAYGEAPEVIGDGKLKVIAKPVYSPSNADITKVENAASAFSFTIKESTATGLVISDGEGALYNEYTLSRNQATRNGTAKFKASMSFAAGGKNFNKTSNELAIATSDKAYTFTVNVEAVEGVTYDASMSKIVMNNNGLTAKIDASVNGFDDSTVNITSGDSKILKYANGSITSVASGTTWLKLTAKADKTVVKYITVTVGGTGVMSNVVTVALDRAKTAGVTIKLTDEAGLSLEGAKVAGVYKGALKSFKGTETAAANADSLILTNIIGGYYKLRIGTVSSDSASMLAKGTYSIKFQNEDGTFFSEPVTLKVVETNPAAAVKQTKKVNLYYLPGTDANTGYLKTSSKFGKVRLTQTNALADHFTLIADGSGYEVAMKASSSAYLLKGSKIKLNKKMNVTMSVEGYKNYTAKNRIVTVSAVTKKPKYVLELTNSTFYTKLGIDSTEVKIWDKDAKAYVEDANVTLAGSKPSYVKANENFYIRKSATAITLKAPGGKNGTAKISVISPDFAKDKYGATYEIILNAPIKVSNAIPKATFKNATLVAALPYAGKEQSRSLITVKGADGININNFKVVRGANAKSQKILPYLNFGVEKDEFGKNIMTVMLQDAKYDASENSVDASNNSVDARLNGAIAARIIKPGTYKFKATYDLNLYKGAPEATITVKLVKQPKVTGKVKGSLNPVARTTSSIVITPTLKNLTGDVVGMTFGDDSMFNAKAKMTYAAGSLFDVKWDSSKASAVVTLNEDLSYKARGKYKVVPVFTVRTEGGDVQVAGKPITLKTSQKPLKFGKTGLIETGMTAGSTALVNLPINTPTDALVETMVQETMNENFAVSYDTISEQLEVKVASSAGLVSGKTYTIKMSVIPVNSGSGAKAQKLSVKVRVH